MKQYLGNYLGMCICNQDPEFRGRVKIFIPNIMPALYENWNKEGKDITFTTIGDNVEHGLPSSIVKRLEKILPWAECAAPVVGGSTVGSYAPSSATKNETGYDIKGYSAVMPTNLTLNMTDEQNRALAQFQKHYEKNQSRYDAVAKELNAKGIGMTSEQVAAIHWREGTGSFDKSIANGQALSKPARLDGKMGTGGKTYSSTSSWEANAVEVMTHKAGEKRAPNDGQPWSDSTFYTFAEKFNGTGYKSKGLATPYVYSGTTTYTGGKYVKDGPNGFDPNVKDRQLGVAVLTSSLNAKKAAAGGAAPPASEPPPNPADAQSIPDPSQSIPEKPPFGSAAATAQKQGGPESTIPLSATPPPAASTAAAAATAAPSTGGGWSGTSSFNIRGADMDGLNSEFRRRIEGMAAEFLQKTGKKMTVTDGWRSYAVQVDLARRKGIYGQGGLAARPGTSNHGFGFAVDISTADVNTAKGLGLFSKWGVHTPMVSPPQGPAGSNKAESWHVEPTGLNKSILAPYKAKKQSGYYKGDYFAAALTPGANPPPPPGDSAPEEMGSSTQMNNEVNVIKHTTDTTSSPTDTSGMPEGAFAIPSPGAMLWVFFREGNPLHPVYFAASYGGSEWSAAYGSSSPEAHLPNPGDDTPRSKTIMKNGGGIELTNTNELGGGLGDIGSSKKDHRGAKIFAPSGAYTHWHARGIINYSPNELFCQSVGNSYQSCLNKESFAHGDSNDIVLGDQFIIVGTLTKETLDAVDKCAEIIKSINEVKMKQ